MLTPMCFQFSILKVYHLYGCHFKGSATINPGFSFSAKQTLLLAIVWWASLFWELGPMFGLSQLALHTQNTPFSVLALQVKARASSFGSFLILY
jgi:hypothetical protein